MLSARKKLIHLYPPSPSGRKGGQASNGDLFPLGYGERDRVRVRVKIDPCYPHIRSGTIAPGNSVAGWLDECQASKSKVTPEPV